MADSKGQIVGSAPYFMVRDVRKAVAYYCDVLGFTCPRLWGDPPCFAMPFRDAFIVMLSQPESEHAGAPLRVPEHHEHWSAYFWVRDADALFEEFTRKGAIVEYEPRVQESYGMKEFAVRDPDGNLLAFGQDIEGEVTG